MPRSIALQRLLYQGRKGHPLDRLNVLEQNAEIDTVSDTRVNEISEITDNLGRMTAGEFIAPASGAISAEPTNSGFTGAAMGGNGWTFDNDTWLFVSVLLGALKFGIRASDGSVFSDGDYLNVLDRWVDLGAGIYASGGNTPQIRCSLYDSANGVIYLGGSFNISASGGAAANIVKYTISTGVFSNLSPGYTVGGSVYALAMDSNGILYIGGNVSNAGGDANADLLCQYDGVSYSAVGTAFAGVVGTVLALAVDENDNLYVGGTFSDVGDASGDKIVMWNGSAYSSLGSGLNNTVWAIAPSGSDVYIGGEFTDAGGVANADKLCKWNGSAFSAVGSSFAGASGDVYALSFDSAGNLYIGGSFTNIGGANGDGVVKWDGSAYSSLGSGYAGIVWSLGVDSDDNLYIGGDASIYSWDGSSMAEVGNGLNQTTYSVLHTGSLYAFGSFTADNNGAQFLFLMARHGAATLKELLDYIFKNAYKQSAIIGAAPNTALASNATRYSTPFRDTLGTTAIGFVIPRNGYLRNFSAERGGTQPAGGDLVLTIYNPNVSSMQITFRNSDAGTVYQNTTDVSRVVAGSTIYLECVNGTTIVNSAPLSSWSVEFIPD